MKIPRKFALLPIPSTFGEQETGVIGQSPSDCGLGNLIVLYMTTCLKITDFQVNVANLRERISKAPDDDFDKEDNPKGFLSVRECFWTANSKLEAKI